MVRAVWRECIHCQEERLTVTLSRVEAEQLCAESIPGRGGVTGKLFAMLRHRTGVAPTPRDPKPKPKPAAATK